MNAFCRALFLVFCCVMVACNSLDDKSVALMEDLARLLDAHKSDCEEMGQAVSEFMASRQDLLNEMRKLDQVSQDAIFNKYGKRIETAKKRILDRLLDCTENQKVVDAVNQLN